MKRRNFLLNSFTIGAGIVLVPNLTFAKYLFPENDSGFIDFETYKKDYQDKLNTGKIKISDAINYQLKVGDIPNRVMTDYYAGAIDEVLRKRSSPPITPALAFKQKKNANTKNNVNLPHANKGRLFQDVNNKESGIFIGPQLITKNKSNELIHSGATLYYCHSAFILYTQLEEYFCYGRPSSHPYASRCKFCSQEYVTQKFYYEGDSIYDRAEKEFYYNVFCERNPQTNSYGQRVHDGVPTNLKFTEILPCKMQVDSPCNRNFTIKEFKS